MRRGRTRETRDDALEDADAVCSVRTVVLWAMHALCLVLAGERKVARERIHYSRGVDEDEDAISSVL